MTLIDKLEFILKCIWDDGEFIRGVQGCLKDDKDRHEKYVGSNINLKRFFIIHHP